MDKCGGKLKVVNSLFTENQVLCAICFVDVPQKHFEHCYQYGFVSYVNVPVPNVNCNTKECHILEDLVLVSCMAPFGEVCVEWPEHISYLSLGMAYIKCGIHEHCPFLIRLHTARLLSCYRCPLATMLLQLS